MIALPANKVVNLLPKTSLNGLIACPSGGWFELVELCVVLTGKPALRCLPVEFRTWAVV